MSQFIARAISNVVLLACLAILCPAALAVPTEKCEIEYAGLKRVYYVHLPPSACKICEAAGGKRDNGGQARAGAAATTVSAAGSGASSTPASFPAVNSIAASSSSTNASPLANGAGGANGNHVPPHGYPLLVVLHGDRGAGYRIERYTGFDDLCDRDNFIAVYPDGYEAHWNDGRPDTEDKAHRDKLDDVGFLSKLIELVSQKYHVDKSRVFMCGISNGGMMTFRFACEQADKLRGIATVAASMPANLMAAAKPSRPVPAMIMAGTSDPIIPFIGGMISVFGKEHGKVTSPEDSAAFWAKHNGCNMIAQHNCLPDKSKSDLVACQEFRYVSDGHKADVIFIKEQGAGHTWPGGRQYAPMFLIGKTCRDFSATEMIWKFFSSL